MVADAVNTFMSRIIEPYRKWIIANPQLLADIENTIRCLSYFSAGHFNNSLLASEFIYSIPNLLILLNDLLMRNGKSVSLKLQQFESKIKVWLTVVEYTETLFEISAKKLWGEAGKWMMVTLVQVFKTVLRLMLVHVYKEHVIKSPPIQPINREQLVQPQAEKEVKEGFTLKRTKTVVRSIRTSSSIETRNWEPLPPVVDDNHNFNKKPASERNLLLAESLYALKPLLHLGCISVTGEKRWPPWLLSFFVDLVSLKIFSDEQKAMSLSKEDQKEICRRRLNLLLYILRSPFYDKYSRIRIYMILNLLSAKVPLARLLAEPIKKYLPHWQSMYFSMWSS